MILASGSGLPAPTGCRGLTGTVVYEIDQPKVIEFKTSDDGPTSARRRPRSAARWPSISREDWPAALRRSGFDDSQPTAWSAEGLLVYLPPEAQDRLFDNITALSAPGSQLATEYHPDAGASIGRARSSNAGRMAAARVRREPGRPVLPG